MRLFIRDSRIRIPLFACILALCISVDVSGQPAETLEGKPLYDTLKQCELRNKASVSGLKLKRDRGEMTFSGDFYFAAPVNGRVTGAVFIGEGTFRAEAPPIAYEKENLLRFLNAEVVESDFKTAVLRFTDNTFDIIGNGSAPSDAIPGRASDLAKDMEPRFLEETGINISARLALSLSNNEIPGVFLAQFDKGKLDRFTFLLDPQTRIPTSIFGLNAGEKTAVFKYASYAYTNDLWIVTCSEEDFDKGRVNFSDEFDIVNPLHYRMEIDLTNPRKILKTKMRIDFESLVDGLRAVPMIVNDGLTAYDNKRLDESMKVQSAQLNGRDIPCIQEDWEIGLTFLLPKAMAKGEKFSIDVALEGDFIDNQQTLQNFHYPQSNSSWYPRHGFLKRSTFDLLFRHDKDHHIASIGKLIREEKWPDDSKDGLTEYRMDDPVSFATFGAGRLERHTESRELEFGKMDLNFYSFITGVGVSVKEEFVLAELGNTLNFFSSLFGPYPYKDFQSVVHPFNFGQGFPTLLLIAPADAANREVFSFIAHEASHQWWGNLVAWRSYRDQWLSEGFAEYSGLLYTLRRDSFYSVKEIMKEKRHALEDPPVTDTGVGKGKAVEMGPLILGRRLNSRLSRNAYQLLTYDKGCFVLRMLHYLFSDPYDPNKDQRFYGMLQDFVSGYANRQASTDDFIAVASAHFAETPIAKTFGLKDLRWFFNQWVYQSNMPNYRMEYRIDKGENDQAIISGKILQENAGPNWFMPLPVVLKFPGGQKAQAMVYANGPEAEFQIPLPMKPDSVDLDPDMWILSEKTETKKK